MSSDAKLNPRKQSPATGPNMTPMVDVVMCILIFFMLGSTFLAPEFVLASSSPAIAGSVGPVPLDAPPPPVRLTLTLVRRADVTWLGASDGSLLPMNAADRTTTRSAVLSFLRDKRALLSDTAQVVIAPQKDVPYQDVVTIFDDCTASHFGHVAFAPAH